MTKRPGRPVKSLTCLTLTHPPRRAPSHHHHQTIMIRLPPNSPLKKSKQQGAPSASSPSRRSAPSRLVWHSNVGSSLKSDSKSHNNQVQKKGGFFSAFQYNNPSKKKTVHFATIEVQPYNWDYSCDEDVYYRKEQITAMNKQRFTDASKLRKERNIKVPPKDKNKDKQAMDDVDIAKRHPDIDQLLQEAFDPNRDIDEEVSIRGIEHFVYPTLQQEMIRRKKHAKRELINFQHSKRPDPRGWRLARQSEMNTQWAREVAIEKGMRYCMNQEAIYGAAGCGISRDELERSKDELDNLHMLKSSASCCMETSREEEGEDGGGGGGVRDITSMMPNVKMAYSTDEESREVSQTAGADTRED
mmetsp:Transcript_20362/g.31871  ORF Transcript_20362/g.31871 Transcript_20362/m.31871 type:complete len:358 (-) Transcript_20362:52-1125(-)